jgi:hypothetical protein
LVLGSSTEDCTHILMFARQVLHHFSHAPVLFGSFFSLPRCGLALLTGPDSDHDPPTS